eukprot:Transcript_12766.p2 GENE.Transcript_12766~~Transcript_12766.p2  ORF type:complete len:480 (-),score=191.13 Transcript_12766:23-1462(-)
MAPPPRVLVLAGPTAIGKSALALRLCEQLPGELISVDSVQVYRGLQIGSAKPSAEERGRVRHHLLDIRDPTDEYTAGSFYRDALHAVQDVLSRGNTPVLVGGTMMYMRWLAHGRPGAPKSDPEIAERVRQRLEPFESAGDWEAGLAVLQELDAARAAQLFPNDWYRLHRAVVVAMQGGEMPPAEASAEELALDAFRASLDFRAFFLSGPRLPLCERIDSRCCAMLEGGLLEEVTEELLQLRLLPSSPAGRSIGYRQALEFLTREPYAADDAAALLQFVEGFTAASRRYAAQQVKWFRNEPSFAWLQADWARAAPAPAAAAGQPPEGGAAGGGGAAAAGGGPAAAAAAAAPPLCLEQVLAAFRCSRADFDAGLAAPSQAALRAPRPDEGKAMRRYVPSLPVLSDARRHAALLRRADACCERLQPKLDEIRRADAATAERYPWHTREKRGSSVTAPLSDDEAGGPAGGKPKATRTDAGPGS